jgi:hypothetical protein
MATKTLGPTATGVATKSAMGMPDRAYWGDHGRAVGELRRLERAAAGRQSREAERKA